MEEEIQIISVNSETFETQEYNLSDRELLTVSLLDTEFSQDTDYIEICVYDENQNKIYTTPNGETLRSYNVKEGDVLLNPQQNLEELNFDIDTYFIKYSFYKKRLNSDSSSKFFISEISSDRTELRLDSNEIEINQILSSSLEFIEFRENSSYFVDFYLNFGSNQSLIANNIKLDNEQVLIKLYEPLPEIFDVKSTLWVVEEISTPQTYQVTFPFTPEIPNDFTFISGPNFSLDVKGETGVSSQEFSYDTLLSSNVTSSISQIQNLLKEKQININVNYEDFNEFIHFSSAKTRLENFYYKVGLIESAKDQMSNFLGQITSPTTTTPSYITSKEELTSQINNIIENFDGYEYFMYFNSGSLFSYPKSNTEPPYNLYSTGSVEVLTWLGNADPASSYFGGIALSASEYDQNNKDWLYWSIPEYLRTDENNLRYELFVDMVGQHYDNIWLYTKDITNKFNADNRLDYGISKDLVYDAIKDFGIKLYSNNFNSNDLYTAFLGITPSGSLFPFPEITDSLPAESGYEYVDTRISSSNNIIPLDGVNKRLYKRIYHNIPYLLKTKGTIAGLRSLITSYGIPDTILRINEFGGKDKDENQNWDLEQRVFNYAFDTGIKAENYFSSSFKVNDFMGSETNISPRTIQFRFKSPELPLPVNDNPNPNIRYSQSLFSTDNGGNIVLEYTGSGLTLEQYSGSSPNPYDYYGTIKWIPDNTENPSLSASIYLPFFKGDWWSVQMSYDGNTSSSLYVANHIDEKLGFTGSDEANGANFSYYDNSISAFLNKDVDINLNGVIYKPFSGSFQELRYWSSSLEENIFFDYVLNPYSNENNNINSTPDNLIFRADLGTQLDTGSITSIHPRVTGSISQITESFDEGNSNFFISSPTFVTNVEKIYQDQVIAGIKNRITDKIQIKNNILPEIPSGSNESITVLSPLRSIQQTLPSSGSYSPNINYLEVALSPQDQINDDINAQIGHFNLGDYIGDPRQNFTSDRNYPDLNKLRDKYFEKYYNNYNVLDFVRLIKFFDNSLFKMIKDFTPARTSLSSGVVIKQHLLERNRQRPAQVGTSNETYSGSIKPQSRNYNTGSTNTSQFEYVNGSSIYKFSGGTGGSFERYNGLSTSPSSSAYGLSNKFNLTQSYSESIVGSVANAIDNSGFFVGHREVNIFNQEEFYNGEFSGSLLNLPYNSKNPTCAPYLKVSDKPIFFNPIIFSITDGALQGTTTETEIAYNLNSPNPGDAWIISKQVQISPPLSKVIYIKISNLDANNIFIGDYLTDSDNIQWITSDAIVEDQTGVAEYKIEGVTEFANSTLLRISQTSGDNILKTIQPNTYYPITSSQDGGSENWSLDARGDFSTPDNISQSNNNLQQGNFKNSAALNQTQYFWYYNGIIDDEQGFFNTGSSTVNTSDITSDPNLYSFGAYNIKRTPNIPWYYSCSIAYSASDLGTGNSITSSNNIYHSASKYSGVGLTDQDFTFDSGLTSGLFKPSPLITDVNTTLFNENYNNLIPGDSSSADNTIGGHPKIAIAATASIDFYFPSLTIGGTPRSLAPDIAEFTPISGSDLNTSNIDFPSPSNMGFNSYPYMSYSGSGETEDGAIQIDRTTIELILSDPSYGYTNPDITSIKVYYDLFISSSIENYTSSISISNYRTTTPGVGFVVDSPTIISAANKEINIINGTFDLSRTPTGSGTEQHAFRIELKSPEESFDYYIETFEGYLEVSFTHNGGSSIERFPQSPYNSFENSNFHGDINTLQEFTSSFDESGDEYPLVDIRAQLRRTGSGIPEGGYLITQSAANSPTTIFGGKTFEFLDSPILNIINTNPLDTDTTINNENDMYFIAYSMSGYDDRSISSNATFDVEFLESGDLGSKIILEQRADSVASDGYDLTGSLIISRGNTDSPTSLGDNLILGNFIVPNSSSNDRVTLTGSFSYPFRYDDVFRMGIEVNKSFGSGLNIQEYTMSIYPSSSRYAPLDDPSAYDYYKIPTSSGFIIPSYFGPNILPFNIALDCQPLLNNYNDIRPSTFLMDVDYNNITGSITPVNISQILNNTALPATVPDSNYTMIRSINPRYQGSKSTSAKYNVWSPTDTGTFGKLPTIDLKKAYFSYFNEIEDPYPNINDKIKLNIQYLVDEQGNALPPSLEGTSRTIFERVYPSKGFGKVAVETSDKILKELNSTYQVSSIGNYYSPVMYSQTSSRGYTESIPLTGSGRISRYDNNDSGSVDSFAFTALGTASLAPSTSVREFNYIIAPSEDISIKPYAETSVYNGDGIITYNGTHGTPGQNLTNKQILYLETQFVTSYIYDTNKVRNEVSIFLKMIKNSTNLPFTVTDIKLSVLKSNQKVYDLGSVMGESWIEFIGQTQNTLNNQGTQVRNTPYNSNIGSPPGFRLQSDNSMHLTLDWEMNTFLVDKGVYQKGGDTRFQNPDLLSLIWTIEANSNPTDFREADTVFWEISGSAKKSSKSEEPDTVFFPEDHVGSFTPTKITSVGALDHLFDSDNTGSAPFWVFTGSTAGASSILDQKILVMSSSNINEAYGTDFYQGNLPYTPGPSEYHPSGQEPSNTNFDPIVFPLTLKKGDEIRFSNNENYTYIITEVFNPSQNIEGDEMGRLKIVLDKEVPTDVNKDFFLVRRNIPNANSIYLNGTFPYGNPASGIAAPSSSTTPGIFYPDFPTTYLENSASMIVNELTSKGIIT